MFGSVHAWLGSFVAQKGLGQQGLVAKLQGAMQRSDGKLDAIDSWLNASTNYLS